MNILYFVPGYRVQQSFLFSFLKELNRVHSKHAVALQEFYD